MATPKKLTNKYIDDEIAKLDRSISYCDQMIVSLTKKIQGARKRHKIAYDKCKEEYMRISHPEMYDMKKITYAYTKTMENEKEIEENAIKDLDQQQQQKWMYEAEKRNLEKLRKKTEEERIKEYNQ
jgi:hypothetical protein